MIEHHDADRAGVIFSEIAEKQAADYAHGDVADEEDFSGQLIGRIKGVFDGLKVGNSRWQVGGAVTEVQDGPLQPRVRVSGRQLDKRIEEPEYGADIAIVLDIQSGDYKTQKGVLIQAKRLVRGQSLANGIATKLRSQCSDMLDHSAASFVFLYAPSDVAVLSATIVEGSKRNDLHALEQFHHSAPIFFSDFVKCWIGDPRLRATDQQSLAVLRDRTAARNALLLSVDAGVS